MADIELYHFTTHRHLDRILQTGFLKTVESNISFRRTGAGPRVVWLTTEQTATLGLGLAGSAADKTELRFTVRIPASEAHDWKPWARAHGSTQKTIEILARTGGGADTWRVVEREIPESEWVEIRDMKAGKPIEWRDHG